MSSMTWTLTRSREGSVEDRRRRRRAGRRGATAPIPAASISASSDTTDTILSGWPRTFVIDPERAAAEHQQSEQHDHHEEDPGESRRVTHVEVVEGVLVQVKDEEQKRRSAAAGAASRLKRGLDDVALGKCLQCS